MRILPKQTTTVPLSRIIQKMDAESALITLSCLMYLVVQQLYPGVNDGSTAGVSVRSMVRVTEISELLRSRPALQLV